MAQQYIGCRISLISKSDIRYRGILHSIDPAASTVSLEQVTSLGTEGRKSNPSEEIAPTDQLYEFIVFRAADVKDLSIESPAEPKAEPPKPTVPDDPAIMSTTAPPRPAPFMQPPMMAGPQGMYNNHISPMMYPPGGVPPQWPPYVLPPPGQMHPMMGFPPQTVPPPSAPVQQKNSQPKTQPMSKPKLPAVVSSNQAKSGSSSSNQKASPVATSSPTKQAIPNPVPTHLSTQLLGSSPAMPSSQSQAPSGANGTVEPKPMFGSSTAMDMMASIVAMSSQQGGSPAAHQVKTAVQANTATISASTTKSSQKTFAHPGSNPVVNQHHKTRSNGKLDAPDGHVASSSQSQQHHMRHPLPQVPNKSKPAPKAHGGAQLTSHKVYHGGNHLQPSSASIVPAQDFDFASANAKFTKPASASHHQTKADDPNEQTQSHVALESASINGEANEIKQGEFVIPEAPPGAYYDKKKSFFDDISSEVKERSAVPQDPIKGASSGSNGVSSGRGGRGNGRGGRGKGYDRNAERQKNLDTFGEVALNPNLGALGSGYNGYGRGGLHRLGQLGGNINGYRGMGGRGGRGGHSRGNSSVGMRGGSGYGMNTRGAPSGLIPSVVNQQPR